MRAKEFIQENFSNKDSMSTVDMIAYLRQHHDTNLHQDYLDHINTFSKFALKNIPVNTLKTELSGLDRAKVERYKQMDFSKAPPIVTGDGYILDGYHRAVAAKELGIPTIQAYVGIKGQQDMAEGYRRKLNFDEIYGKYLKVTDNNGDPGKPGFSLVTPLNGDSWNWRERPEFKALVKKKLNQPGWLGDHKYQQIVDAMAGRPYDPKRHEVKENSLEKSPTFDIPRRSLNVPELIKRGAIFITHPHGANGWELKQPTWDFSLITLQNVLEKSPPWSVEAPKYVRPESYQEAIKSKLWAGLGDEKYKQILWSIKKLGIPEQVAFLDTVAENFADGKVKGKSRPGRVKRAGASCNGSVTDLRRKAKNASGERAKMYHWCANMKSGRAKKNK